MELGNSDRMNEPQPLDPMTWDKAQAAENDRVCDEAVPYYAGRSWVTECMWAAFNAETDEDREYFIGEVAMISEGAASEVREILAKGW